MIILSFPLILSDRMLQSRICYCIFNYFLLHYLFAYIVRLDKICIPQIFELLHKLQNILVLCRAMINDCLLIKQKNSVFTRTLVSIAKQEILKGSVYFLFNLSHESYRLLCPLSFFVEF